MKQILFTALLIVASFLFNFSASFAQTETEEDTTKIAFVAYWHKGDIYNFKVTKIKKKWDKDDLTLNDSSQYMARFEVMDSTADSYTIKWTYKTNLKERYQLPEKIVKKLSKYTTTEVIYKTDELGGFKGIENWKEISNMLTDIFAEVIALEKDKDKRKEMKKELEPVMEAYNSQEGIQQLLFKELSYFHKHFGRQYSTTEPFEYEEKLHNLVSSGFIRGEVKLTFTAINRENGYCVLHQESKLNEEDTKTMIAQIIANMKTSSEKISEMIDNANIMTTEDNSYGIYYYGGVPINISTTKTSIIEIQDTKMVQVEKVKIELILEK